MVSKRDAFELFLVVFFMVFVVMFFYYLSDLTGECHCYGDCFVDVITCPLRVYGLMFAVALLSWYLKDLINRGVISGEK